jgi:chemotaxis protein histidine kinase CheA
MSSSIMSVKKVVEECGKLYNFNAEEALRALNIEVKEKKEKVVVSKSKYPLPFNGEKKENCCNGIVKNHGLYTQCEKKVKGGFCKGCESQPYGNIDDRVKVDLYEYKDPKGKSPKRYTEVLKKLKITKETIEEEAKRLNITIATIHFEEVAENVKRGRPKSEKKVKEPTGKKGRPKKETKVLEVSNNEEEEDLFATLIANANANANANAKQALVQSLENVELNQEEDVVTAAEEAVEVVVEESKEVPSPKAEKKAKKVKEADPAKEAEKQKKAEEKAAKEAEKQKKAEEKAAKEAEKQKKAEEKEAEKQKKAEEKAAKEAEKQKKAEEKGAKEAKKNSKALSSPDPNVDEEEADVVQKIEFEGKPYYKSKKNGVIYNMDQEVVGKWNTEINAVDFEEEEEEEEYDD